MRIKIRIPIAILLVFGSAAFGAVEWLPAPKDKSIFGSIKELDESPDWSIYHLDEGDTVQREVKILVVNRTGRPVDVALHVLDRDGKDVIVPAATLDREKLLEIYKVPLFRSRWTLSLTGAVDGKTYLLDRKEFIDPEYLSELEIKAEPEIDPIAAGLFLLKAGDFVLAGDSVLNIKLRAVYLGEKESVSLETRGAFQRNENGEVLLKQDKLFSDDLPGGGIKNYEYKYSFKTEGLTGELSSAFEERLDGTTARKTDFRLFVLDSMPRQRQFGARTAQITYPNPVQIIQPDGSIKKVPWDEVWKDGPQEDIVIDFPTGHHYLFWRGTSYIPFWTLGDKGMTYEWVEAPGNQFGAVDCVEPLMDKECRYSRARIVSSTPARAVVHWRYAEIDLEYKIIGGEWVDEYYTLYPDGFGVRRVAAKLVPGRWHETNEFIVILPPGLHPFHALEPDAVSVLGPDGEKLAVTYPDPSFEWKMKRPTAFRIHLLGTDFTPVMATRMLESKQMLYNGWRPGGRYVCPQYWGDHWPITRGLPTCMEAPKGWKERPAHASLVALVHKPDKVTPVEGGFELTEWSWLIGLTNASDEEFLNRARNWWTPAELKALDGVESRGFSTNDMAFHLALTPGAKKAAVSIQPMQNNPVINLIIVLEGCSSAPEHIEINEKKLAPEKYKFGLETAEGGPNGVLWIPGAWKDPMSITISFK